MTDAVFDFRSIAAKLARNEQRDIARGTAKLEPPVIVINIVGGEPMTFRGCMESLAKMKRRWT